MEVAMRVLIVAIIVIVVVATVFLFISSATEEGVGAMEQMSQFIQNVATALVG